jgi:hypothetical protein
MNLHQLQVVRVRFPGDLLSGVGFRILNEHNVTSTVVEPAKQNQFVEQGRLSLCDDRRDKRERIMLPDILVPVRLESRRNLIFRLAK